MTMTTALKESLAKIGYATTPRKGSNSDGHVVYGVVCEVCGMTLDYTVEKLRERGLPGPCSHSRLTAFDNDLPNDDAPFVLDPKLPNLMFGKLGPR